MPTRNVYLETFGCQMNELDSELVTSQLHALGYRFTPDAAAADIVLYNTCSVRELAEQKVWSRLGEMAVRKETDPGLVVGVLGCMAEREGDALVKRMPVVDVLVGPAELDKLPALLDNAVRTRGGIEETEIDANGKPRLRSAGQVALQGGTSRRSGTLAAAEDRLEMLDLSRAVSPDDHSGSAYVRITRGCNKFCTYCVVPFTRGAEVHRPPQHIIDECKRLADAGVIEVTLLGQTVNHYRFEHGAAVRIGGVTQPQKGRVYRKAGAQGGGHTDSLTGENVTTFADLLREIHEQAPGIKRLRFVTSYPRSFGDDVLQVIRESPRICRYLHVPAQSGSNRMLAAMNRGYTVEEYLEFVDRARHSLHQPEIGRPLTVAGDIIVGFPGETEEDHRATRALLERARYKNCFIFKYSPRPGTVAFDKLTDDVPEPVKRARNNELLALQSRISDAESKAYVGSSVPVFVQGVSKREAKKLRPGTAPHGTVALTVGGRARGPSNGEACVDEGSHVHGSGGAGAPQLSGRTEGDLIVHFSCPPGSSAGALIGTIQQVRIDDARTLSLFGTMA